MIELLDNGVNADTTENDGIYSRYFTNATKPGRYSVKCQVWNDGAAYTQLGFIASSIAPSIEYSVASPSNHRSPIGNFTRIEAAGSFQVS